MDRATKAIKRGSIRLKSYSDLNLIVSDLSEMRACGKSSIKAYQTFIEDVIKWVHHESNDGLKNILSLLKELSILWTEIHNEFFDNLKKFRQQFELILESEQAIDKARANVTCCEQTEMKLNKEMDRAGSRNSSNSASVSPSIEVRKLCEKLREAKRATEIARIEVGQKETENKIVKVIRMKEGLKKMTESQMKLSHKSNVIMYAQKSVVNEFPDESVVSREAMLTMECKAQHAIAKAKTTLQTLSCSSNVIEANIINEYDAPPPYSPYFGTTTNANTSASNSINSHPPYIALSPSTSNPMVQQMNNSGIPNQWPQVATQINMNSTPCSAEPKVYICSKCSSQLVSDHCYVSIRDLPTVPIDVQLLTNLRNTRISG